ncbi:MAG: MFS transporter [Candidatus Microsaccharimonas sp.]
MIQKIIQNILKRRHFWRVATFSEIAELYASRMLRMLALNMTTAFTSIYLYQTGFDVFFIAILWAIFFAYKFFIAIPMAAIIARIGPKHAILVSNFLFIPAMIALAVVPYFGVMALAVMVVFQGASAMLYQIAYAIDFSKVKSVDHAGKEIAYMNIVEKVTTGLSPLIGGIIAYLLGPQSIMVIGAILFAVSAMPLFKTGEVELPNQKLSFSGFPWKLVTRNIAAQMSIGVDVFTSGTVWTLFYAITILGVSSSNQIYIENGILLSVVLLAALSASYMYGRLIDRRRGGELLRFAAIANAITHFMRPFIGSPVAVAGLNVANEAATAGYSMTVTRGNFDNADLSGHRTTYIALVEAVSNLGACFGALLLALVVFMFSDARGMEYFFYIAAGIVLLIATARFPLYRK